MEPVDPNEAPDYYKVIKEPMGKLMSLLELRIILYSCLNLSILVSTPN